MEGETLLSDGVLSLAIGCDVKWLYNASHRLKRPLLRTPEGARWWRLVHQIVSGLHAPVIDAVNAADLFLALDPDTARARVPVSADNAVGIDLAVGLFHDGAALALARGLHFAAARRRGRPRKRNIDMETDAATLMPEQDLARERLRRALQSLRDAQASGDVVDRVLTALTACSAIPFISGDLAASICQEKPATVTMLDLLCDCRAITLREVAEALNRLNARPRGASTRRLFRIEPAHLRDTGHLALTVDGIAINVAVTPPAIVDASTLMQRAVHVVLAGKPYRLLPSFRTGAPTLRAVERHAGVAGERWRT